MASIIIAESCHVIRLVSIRENFIVMVAACFCEKSLGADNNKVSKQITYNRMLVIIH